MSNPQYKDKLNVIINHFGRENQREKAIEELLELALNLQKKDCHINNILEEMADVEIMLDQLKIMYDYDDLFKKRKRI